MSVEHRRVAAASTSHARALADNLLKQGYEFVSAVPTQWELRKRRRRGDLVVTVVISQPSTPPPWGPPPG